MGLFGRRKDEPDFDNDDDNGIDYRELYEDENENEDDDEDDDEYGELYDPYIGDEVMDEAGDAVFCPDCSDNVQLCWVDGTYICPCCKMTMSRSRFFEFIGAEHTIDRCLSCNSNYAYCRTWCEDNPEDD